MQKLKNEKRWLCHKNKMPVSANGTGAGASNDPSTWNTFDIASTRAEIDSLGLGIVFTPDKSILGIDIDHVIKDSLISFHTSMSLMSLLEKANTYTEVSPSKEGLHLLFRMTEPIDLTSNKSAPYEVYNEGRYFTYTGNSFGEPKPIRNVSKLEMLDILSIIGYPWKSAEATESKPNPGNSTFDDCAILERMFSSKIGQDIEDLYNNTSQRYNGDKSSDDFALLSHIAFWSGRDTTQMERIWLKSPLGSREKTQKRSDYRNRTIQAVVDVTAETYSPPKENRKPWLNSFEPKPPLTSNFSPNV